MADELTQFMSITGADQAVAEHLLEACNGNVELAIEMHLDSGFGQPDSAVSRQMNDFESNSADRPRPLLPDIIQNTAGVLSDDGGPVNMTGVSQSQPSVVGDNDVRAPIPQVRGVLVEDPYHALPYQRARVRQPGQSVFDGFRDFQAEARQQEELLNNTAAANEPKTTTETKIRTLQDLFRPPVDITFKGTFEAAKEAATSQNKWLMTNIQNVSEFSCQTLNRDVWSNALVRDLIAEHFILWQEQRDEKLNSIKTTSDLWACSWVYLLVPGKMGRLRVYHDSDEGQRFMIYYPVKSFPNISVIDPRTGECLVVWNKFENMDSQLFCDLVTQFLSSHPDFVCDNEFPPEKRQKKGSVIDEPEDQQLAAAIAASLQEENLGSRSQTTNPESSCEPDGDIETFNFSDDDNSSSKHKQARRENKSTINSEISQCTTRFEANSIEKSPPRRSPCLVVEDGEDESKIDGPCTKLMLRLPEGNRRQIKMAASAEMRELAEYISSIGYCKKKFELVTNFPRRNLTEVDGTRTLQEAGLFPQETIFVQEK